MGAGRALQFVNACVAFLKSLDSVPGVPKLGVGVRTCNPRTFMVGAGESEDQGHFWLFETPERWLSGSEHLLHKQEYLSPSMLA